MTAKRTRIETFVDWFIRLDLVRPDIQELYLSDAERADRMDAAAEDGADGSTHAETIDDWRSAFKSWLSDVRRGRRHGEYPERFATAVLEHFDAVEEWHEHNGSLYQERG